MVSQKNNAERNFHSFYQLIAGADVRLLSKYSSFMKHSEYGLEYGSKGCTLFGY